MTDRELLEQIDACRPASDDVQCVGDGDLQRRLQSDQEARALYDRIQRLDGALQMAMQDVATAEGLEARLLARLAPSAAPDSERAASAEAAGGGDETPRTPSAEADVEPAVQQAAVLSRRRSRRFWLAVGGSAIAASAAWLIFGNRPIDNWPASTDQLLSESSRFFSTEQRREGSELRGQPLLASYPVGVDVRPGRAARWRPLTDFLGRGHNGVAYDLAPRRGASATLYVIRRAGTNLPTGPGFPNATCETGGLWATAWQRDDLIYVLVVKSAPSSPNASSLFLQTSAPV